MFPLLRFSPLLGLLGPFGPALAAITMADVLGGRFSVKALRPATVHPRLRSGVAGLRKRLKSGYVAINQAMIIYAVHGQLDQVGAVQGSVLARQQTCGVWNGQQIVPSERPCTRHRGLRDYRDPALKWLK